MSTATENSKADRLNSTDRKEYKSAITNRRDQVIKALKNEMDENEDNILVQLRADAGLTLTTDQIEELIESTNEQLTNEISRHVESTRISIMSALADCDEEFDRKQREMQDRHKTEWNRLKEERKIQKQALKNKLKESETEIANIHCTELVARKRKLTHNLTTTREKEWELQRKAEDRISFINKYRNRVEMYALDAASNALEKLLMTDTRQDASNLVQAIPSLQEVIEICYNGDGDGVTGLLRRLNPAYQLPAPVQINTKETEVNEDSEEAIDVIPTTVHPDTFDDDDGWATRRQDRAHSEIYDDE